MGEPQFFAEMSQMFQFFEFCKTVLPLPLDANKQGNDKVLVLIFLLFCSFDDVFCFTLSLDHNLFT